jgi:hypothetical protein
MVGMIVQALELKSTERGEAAMVLLSSLLPAHGRDGEG